MKITIPLVKIMAVIRLDINSNQSDIIEAAASKATTEKKDLNEVFLNIPLEVYDVQFLQPQYEKRALALSSTQWKLLSEGINKAIEASKYLTLKELNEYVIY